MDVRVFFSTAEVDPSELQEQTVVVIDVLRATSTIVSALAAGARAIYPVANPEEAVRLASSLGRDETLLCGERKGLKIEGYHLGNSPAEFTPSRVAGRRLVMSTTNGTRALSAASTAARVVVGSLLNLGAAARATAACDSLVVLCAGRDDEFALDDALCAGLLLERLAEANGGALGLNDAGLAARVLASTMSPDADLLRRLEAGQALTAIGLARDVDDCARIDLYDIVPEMQDRMIRIDHVS
jgi:2-phosphosulfolactate phosphatase